MLRPINTCWTVIIRPSGLSGSTIGIGGANGRIAQVSASMIMSRIRRGTTREPKTGATIIMADTRVSGHRNPPTQAAISALLMCMI